ncbi:hypothetical protein KIPB_016768, partial [Kipferlia bialata]|eukprot:g16768.t1
MGEEEDMPETNWDDILAGNVAEIEDTPMDGEAEEVEEAPKRSKAGQSVLRVKGSLVGSSAATQGSFKQPESKHGSANTRHVKINREIKQMMRGNVVAPEDLALVIGDQETPGMRKKRKKRTRNQHAKMLT